MKNTVIRFASMFVVMLVLSFTASAQMSTAYSGEVPFDFTVAGASFKAGIYRVERADPRSENGLITIKDVKNKKTFVFSSMTGDRNQAKATPRLVFMHIDGECHLAAIATQTLSASFAVRRDDTRQGEWKTSKRSEVALKPAK